MSGTTTSEATAWPRPAPGARSARLVASTVRGRHSVLGPVVLAVSLIRCPVMSWAFPNPDARERVCLAYARTVFTGATQAVIHTTVGPCRGVAVWSNRTAWKGTRGDVLAGAEEQDQVPGDLPGHQEVGVDYGRGGSASASASASADESDAVVRVGLRRWRSWQATQTVLSGPTRGVDLRHLAVAAAEADPDMVVAALLGDVLRRADVGGARLGTVATSPEQCALLAPHGFVVSGSAALPDGGPLVWGLTRHPTRRPGRR